MKTIKAVLLYLLFIVVYVPIGIFAEFTVYSALGTQFRGLPFHVPEFNRVLHLDQPMFIAVVGLVILYGAYVVAKDPGKLWGKSSRKETLLGLLILPIVLAIAAFIGNS